MEATTCPVENAVRAPAPRPESAPPTLRSRVSNHADLLPGVKGTSSAARRFRDLVNAFIADSGGLDQCSEIRLSLLRRLASVVVQSELLEARMVNGEQVDIGLLCQLASTAVRLSTRVGVDRIPRDVGVTLADAIRQSWSNSDA